MNNFGPKNNKEKVVFAEEEFRVHVQHQLYKLMVKKGWTEDQFADSIGMDRATMNQIFESDCYVDVRVLGRMFYALGVKPRFTFEEI